MADGERVLAGRVRRTRRLLPDVSELGFRIPDRVTCPRCNGSGKRSAKKGHKLDCLCVACSPCKQCLGAGRVGIPRVRLERQLEVLDERYDQEGDDY